MKLSIEIKTYLFAVNVHLEVNIINIMNIMEIFIRLFAIFHWNHFKNGLRKAMYNHILLVAVLDLETFIKEKANCNHFIKIFTLKRISTGNYC